MSTSDRTPEIPPIGAGKPPVRIQAHRHHLLTIRMRKKRDPDEIAPGSLTKLAAPDGSPSAAPSAASPGYYYTLGSPPSARVSPPLATNQLHKTVSSSPSRHVHAIHESYSKRLGKQVKNGRREILANWRTVAGNLLWQTGGRTRTMTEWLSEQKDEPPNAKGG